MQTMIRSLTGLRRNAACYRTLKAPFSTSVGVRVLQSNMKPSLISSEVAAAPFKKSTFRTKVKNPMVPLLILVSLISSALIKVAGYQQEYEALKRSGETKIGVLKTIIDRLEKGEVFDVQKEIEFLHTSDADKSLEELMKEIEQAESEWMVTEPKQEEVSLPQPGKPSQPVQSSQSEPTIPTTSSSKFL